MNKTNNCIILTERVRVRLTSYNRDHYSSLGYADNEWSTYIFVDPFDLLPSTKGKILVQCPDCNRQYKTQITYIINKGNTVCTDCRYGHDKLIGNKYGRLRVIRLVNAGIDIGVNRVSYQCECECGNLVTVQKNHLLSGGTKSCGCLSHEVASAHMKRLSRSVSRTSRKNNKLTTKERAERRLFDDYYVWRKTVLKRDNHTCQKCGIKKNKGMVAHHINSYRHFPELSVDVNNGAVLCKECHREFHFNFMGGSAAKCTEDHYREWLDIAN